MAKTPKPLENASKWMLSNVFGTTQAQVATVGYAVIYICTLLSLVWRSHSSNDARKKLTGWEIAVVMLFLLLAYLLSIYSIACLTIGSCNVWAWINSVVVLILAALVFLSTFF